MFRSKYANYFANGSNAYQKATCYLSSRGAVPNAVTCATKVPPQAARLPQLSGSSLIDLVSDRKLTAIEY